MMLSQRTLTAIISTLTAIILAACANGASGPDTPDTSDTAGDDTAAMADCGSSSACHDVQAECATDAACLGLTRCLGPCVNDGEADRACVQACGDAFPDGVEAFSAWTACLVCGE